MVGGVSTQSQGRGHGEGGGVQYQTLNSELEELFRQEASGGNFFYKMQIFMLCWYIRDMHKGDDSLLCGEMRLVWLSSLCFRKHSTMDEVINYVIS